MIQVANTKHPVLHYVQQHDYKLFFQHEIEGRKRFFYPPFSRAILLTFKHKIKEVVDAAAYRFAQGMTKNFAQYIVGPAEPVVNRVRNQFLMELLLKLPKDASLIMACKSAIQEQTAILHNEKKFRSVVIIPDVDPM
jgi:primosomal protein N' (replication factor Y)